MRPPYDPRPARRPPEPTWQGSIATTAVVLAVPLLLWVASNPLSGILALMTATVLGAGGRRALQLRRCLVECGGFAVEVADDLEVCVTRQGSAPAC